MVKTNKKWLLAFSYIVLSHLFILGLIIEPRWYLLLSAKLENGLHQKFTDYKRQSLQVMLARIEQNSAEDSIYFIGDSLVQGLNTSTLGKNVVNLGIGHDKVSDASSRLDTYQNLDKTSLIVFSVGINDLPHFSINNIIDDYRLLLEKVKYNDKVIVHGLLPINEHLVKTINNTKIGRFNDELMKLTREYANVRFLAPSSKFLNYEKMLKHNFHIGDGLHLNKHGNAIWLQELKRVLNDDIISQ